MSIFLLKIKILLDYNNFKTTFIINLKTVLHNIGKIMQLIAYDDAKLFSKIKGKKLTLELCQQAAVLEFI